MTQPALTDAQAVEIYFDGDEVKAIAHRYRVPPECIYAVKSGKRYARATALYRDPATINAFLMTMAAWPGDIVLN